MLKDKILAQLLSKYAGVSKKALGLIADKLAKKVTEESGIEQAITDFDNAIGVKDYADDLQREGDTRVGEAKKEWEKKNPPKPTKAGDDPEPPGPGEPEPAWLKKLTGELTTMKETVTALQKEKSMTGLQQKAAEQLKEVPKEFWSKRALPDSEDGLQQFVDDVTADYGNFKQGLIDAGLMANTPPAGGGADKKSVNEKAVQADITAWAKTGAKPAESGKT